MIFSAAKSYTDPVPFPSHLNSEHGAPDCFNEFLLGNDLEFDDSDSPDNARFASVAIIGPPNAGKSSLMNRLVGVRISGVSRKVNTTRRRLVGALTQNERQMVFYDTPGVVERAFLGTLGAERREIASEGWGAAADADVTVVVVDASARVKRWRSVARIVNHLIAYRKESELRGRLFASDSKNQVTSQESKLENPRSKGEEYGNPCMLLVLNKMDITRPRTRLLEAVEFFQNQIDDFDTYFHPTSLMVSAYNGRGVEDLKQKLFDMTKPGRWVVPSEARTCEAPVDQIEELIREKLLHRLHQEIPYRIQLENVSWTELENGGVAVKEVIWIPRKSLIPIVIGHRGSIVKWVAEEAAKAATETVKREVHILLRVAAVKSSSSGN